MRHEELLIKKKAEYLSSNTEFPQTDGAGRLICGKARA